ncbi:MAG: ATP-binding cassette domain-containing protein, partial [Phycisphaerales bacterium]
MIRADCISLAVGSFRLQRLSIEVETGQYFVLLGPPGAGKSVFLECICGLRRVNSGKMYIDERDVTDLEPSARQVG